MTSTTSPAMCPASAERATTPPARAGQSVFWMASALLFSGSVATTVAWCASMSEMNGMAMPGGWTMSMAWMRMPGQTWLGAATSFLGMWIVMMVAMMLPSLIPTLDQHRRAAAVAGQARRRLGPLTALVGAGYFLVWTGFGVVAFPLGVALAELEMRHAALARTAPIGVGVVVALAGLLQLTQWKARHLACCRTAPGGGGALRDDAGLAFRSGLRLGLHCGVCCLGPMAVLLALGVMDLRAMAIVTAAITVERLAPGGQRAARAIGVLAAAAGLLLIASAAAFG